MENYYFTYGLEDEFPFRGGWTVVRAADFRQAEEAFKAYHPKRDNGCMNYAFVYGEEDMEKSGMLKGGNFGSYCHEIIRADGVS